MSNETNTDFALKTYLTQKMNFSNVWVQQKTEIGLIKSILSISSKKNTGKNGSPDLIYVNEGSKLLILLENKFSIKYHVSSSGNKPIEYAVDGIKHYLSFFCGEKLKSRTPQIQNYIKDWKIIGIAFSGDINDKYNHSIDTFIIEDDVIKNINKHELLDEDEYIAFFENIDIEKITNEISKSSSEINRLLRNLESSKRPVLLSALMICLYPQINNANFKSSYSSWNTQTIIWNIPNTVESILLNEGIDRSKINILLNELTFINSDIDLTTTNILKDILLELENKVIVLFKTKTSYDIIGKFYEEFLRYAGITNVKKGIVLTPHHITTLFTELIELKINDVIFDPACGTGAFLISGMNKLEDKINNSNIQNKNEMINNIKSKQLIGIEKSTTMYSLAISNMLFRGDGKSQIFCEDFFSSNSDEIINNLIDKPTIGFINPPYGGKDNSKNPTKKEIQFLEKMLDVCTRYGVIIAPLSTYFKDDIIRERILTKHTLKYVINMPSELFQPNASTHTAIAVFETHKPHLESKVIFYELKDDGFVLSKNKGRTNVLNKWADIKKDLLDKISNPSFNDDGINLVYKSIIGSEEWIIQAHSKTDYNQLSDSTFEKSIREYVIFLTKQKLNLLDEEIDELELLEILNKNNISAFDLLLDNGNEN